MNEGNFSFLPRKITRSATRPTVKVKSAPRNASAFNSTRSDVCSYAKEAKEDIASSTKWKEPLTNKYLEDSAYTALLELALSDYTIWADAHLMESMSSNADGCEYPLIFFSSLRGLIERKSYPSAT